LRASGDVRESRVLGEGCGCLNGLLEVLIVGARLSCVSRNSRKVSDGVACDLVSRAHRWRL